MQQLLVKIGDKPRGFVGSNQWIGAIELSYVLDEYLGVTSRIITVSKWVALHRAWRDGVGGCNWMGVGWRGSGGGLTQML